jgi:hypothetical protein
MTFQPGSAASQQSSLSLFLHLKHAHPFFLCQYLKPSWMEFSKLETAKDVVRVLIAWKKTHHSKSVGSSDEKTFLMDLLRNRLLGFFLFGGHSSHGVRRTSLYRSQIIKLPCSPQLASPRWSYGL